MAVPSFPSRCCLSISNLIALLFLRTHVIFSSTFSLSILLHASFLGVTSERRRSVKKRTKNSQSQSPILRMRGRKRPVGRSKPGISIQRCPRTFPHSGINSPPHVHQHIPCHSTFPSLLLKPPQGSPSSSKIVVAVCANGNVFSCVTQDTKNCLHSLTLVPSEEQSQILKRFSRQHSF